MEAKAIKDLDITFIIFEVVPLERLRINDPAKDIHSIMSVLQQSGLEPLTKLQTKETFWLSIRDRQQFDELIWLLTEFFEYVILFPTSYDLLFALASTKNPDLVGPHSKPAEYISTEIGNPIYPPSLARILCAAALRKYGNIELGTRIDCVSSFPTETALTGDISF